MAMRSGRSDLQILTAAQLRKEISARNCLRGRRFEHELSIGETPSVIYQATGDQHGNFLPASYARILANPAWNQRLAKAYTASRQVPRSADRRRFELECANSSDALLMNIFCYPRVLSRPGVCSQLGIDAGLDPRFGIRPGIPLQKDRLDRTEIDMQLGPLPGGLFIEAKLTEGDFQRAPLRLLARYRDFESTFDPEQLPAVNGVMHSYQLIRGVLAASAHAASFIVFCDRRRADLIDRWFSVLRAVIDASLRTRLGLLTWQELSATLPPSLRQFLDEKYGIRD
jgi:hypothetical protein